MKIFKLFYDIEKEEKWLNEQLQNGYRCTKISGLGIYSFEKTDKKYVIRLDYQDFLSKEKLEEYKGTYEDFGWTCLRRMVGYWPGRKYYWQKEADEQNEIFSDRESKGNYYKRLMGYSFCWAILFFVLFDKDFTLLYHENLWNMNGKLFWVAFLFETPFVLLKLTPVLLFVYFGSRFYKAYRKYSVLKER